MKLILFSKMFADRDAAALVEDFDHARHGALVAAQGLDGGVLGHDGDAEHRVLV